MKWSEPDVEKLVEYLCGEKLFNEERVRNGAKKLLKAKTGQTQGRLESFFKVLPSSPKKRKVSIAESELVKSELLSIFF